MADRSVSYPRGIVEDLLVKVNDFIFPCDFIVLDMEEDKNVPLILGRPFLATAQAMIDVQRGELTLRLNNESMTFPLDKEMKRCGDNKGASAEQCQVVNLIEDCVREVSHETFLDDHQERSIPQSFYPSHNFPHIDKVDHNFMEFSGVLDSAKQGQQLRKSKFLPPKTEGEIYEGVAMKKKVMHAVAGIKHEDGPSLAKPKMTWWKKRLNKLYLAELKKDKDVNEVIRVRIN